MSKHYSGLPVPLIVAKKRKVARAAASAAKSAGKLIRKAEGSPSDDENENDIHDKDDNYGRDNDNTTNKSNGPDDRGRCDVVSERYEKLGRRLGQGTYGIVYQARDRETNTWVALKRCIPHHQDSDGFPITTLREIQSLRLCASHPHIVQLQNVAVSASNGVFLVFEYCEHDLSNLIDSHFGEYGKSPFSQAQVKTLLRHLLLAVQHLHSRHLIHRDIKLSNLLYTDQGMLKLADFGLSRPYAHDVMHLTPQVASLWYRPMELLLGATTYTTAIDLWAVGCILGELLTGQPLMKGTSELDQIDKVLDCLGYPPHETTAFFQTLPLIQKGQVSLYLDNNYYKKKSRRTILTILGDILSHSGLELLKRGLLHFDPALRWDASQALSSPYFDEQPRPTAPTDMPRFARSFQT